MKVASQEMEVGQVRHGESFDLRSERGFDQPDMCMEYNKGACCSACMVELQAIRDPALPTTTES